jgi:hypothetical protein
MPITFKLPANDAELVEQVYDHIDNNGDFSSTEMLLDMARKYRFAGYIGTIEYLFEEIRRLSKEIETLKNKKKGWW